MGSSALITDGTWARALGAGSLRQSPKNTFEVSEALLPLIICWEPWLRFLRHHSYSQRIWADLGSTVSTQSLADHSLQRAIGEHRATLSGRVPIILGEPEADLDVLVSTQTFSNRKEGHGIWISYHETYQRIAHSWITSYFIQCFVEIMLKRQHTILLREHFI